jgi:hypothetical protein
MFTVKHSAEGEWLATVKAGATTRHRMRVRRYEVARVAEGWSAKDLLESFHFRLERESNTFILSSFDPFNRRLLPGYEQGFENRLTRTTT